MSDKKRGKLLGKTSSPSSSSSSTNINAHSTVSILPITDSLGASFPSAPVSSPSLQADEENKANETANHHSKRDYDNPAEWSCEAVCEWLNSKGFHDVAKIFREQEIDGKILLTLREHDLKSPPLSLKKFGEIRRLAETIENLWSAKREDSFYVDGPSPLRKRQSYSWSTEKTLPVWERNLEWKSTYAAAAKVLFSMGYLAASLFVTSVVMTIVPDRTPNQEAYPPLPDIVLDNIIYITWAFKAAEICAITLVAIFFLILIFHRHRLVIMWRVSAIVGTVFLLRCVTMFVTSLSVPGQHLQCSRGAFGKTLEEKLWHAYHIVSGFGMSLSGVHSCGDYMFSGHTSVLTLMNYSILEYTPTDWEGLHILTWVLNLFGMFFVLAAHEHYTIDVIIAFYISSRLFLNYHSMADLKALTLNVLTPVTPMIGVKTHKLQSAFPIFSY